MYVLSKSKILIKLSCCLAHLYKSFWVAKRCSNWLNPIDVAFVNGTRHLEEIASENVSVEVVESSMYVKLAGVRWLKNDLHFE